MDPVGGDLFVVGNTQQSQQSGKNGQKLAGNNQNVDELHCSSSTFWQLLHQTVSHFLSKKALILTQEGKEYLYSDVVRIHES